MGRVEAWLAAAPAVVVRPTTDPARILWRLLDDVGSGGNLVNDAHLAALAGEHRCAVASFDNDFDRFDGVEWLRPTAPA